MTRSSPERRTQNSQLTTHDSPGTSHPFAAFTWRDFRYYWAGSLVSTTGTQMRQAAIAWQVYLLTHSPIALGLIGLFRVIPIVLFSIAGGVVADVIDRRRLLLIVDTVLLLVSIALAAATIFGNISLWAIYGLVAVGAAAVSFENPARQAMVPSLVPRATLANALSLTSTAFQVATVLGPSLAGVVIATYGIGAVYVVDVISYVGVLIALFVIHPPPILGGIQKISLQAAIEGLRFVRRTPIILSTMSLDFMATFFSSATALLPIFAQDILRVGSQGYGILYAAPSIGAIAAGVVLSFYASAIRAKGAVILVAVGVYGVCTILFGLSHVFLLSLLALAGTGAADTVSMIMRQTVRQIVTPDTLRGRMTSVNMVFVMGGPQLGEVEAGLVAKALGAPFSVISGGVAAVLGTIAVAAWASGLRHYRD